MHIINDTITFFATAPGHLMRFFATHPPTTAAAVICFAAVAVCADIVRQLRLPDEVHQAQPNPLRQDGPSWSGPRRDHRQMRAALDVLADHGRHRPVPPPPRIDWTTYPTAAPTERYIQPRIRRDSQIAMLVAQSEGDKRCGIRRHRLSRPMMTGRAWLWWWAGLRTAAGWWWQAQTTHMRDWWAQTTPAQPWTPVAKALTAPPREPVAVVWAPRGQAWAPSIVSADEVPVTRSPLTTLVAL